MISKERCFSFEYHANMKPETAIGKVDAQMSRAHKIIQKNKVSSPSAKVKIFLNLLDNLYLKLA